MKFEWHKYKVQGINEQTGRKKTLKIIAHNQEAAETDLIERGLLPPYSFDEEDFEQPTDRQIDYAIDLGIRILPTMNKKDISALIDKKLEDDSEPSEDLLQFAYDKNIYFSPYIGEKNLCNLIFDSLESKDKVAFFCFAVSQSLKGDKLGNMDTSFNREKFYEFANLYSYDDSFCRSLERYKGEELIFFGVMKDGNEVIDYGGSKRKKAYKLAVSFIKNGFDIIDRNSEAEIPALLNSDNLVAQNSVDELPVVDTGISEEVTSEGFISVGEHVAMPEETVAKVLGVTIERMHELSEEVGVTNSGEGIYIKNGKYYCASPEIIFKLRDTNGKKSADLSRTKIYGLFCEAEKRLLPEQYRRRENKIMLRVGAIILLIFVYVHFSSDTQEKTIAPSVASKVEIKKEKSAPSEIERPEESFYKESYEAIAAKTGLRVTEHWLLEYGERVTRDGNIDTHGFVEFNNDGVKRQFWLVFDGKSRRVLRIKIDADLIYNELDW